MAAAARVSRPGALLRPSALARFWALHPKTVIDWIRAGALVAVRSPGSQYRLRAGDIREFCARQSLPVPPFAQTDVTRIVLAGVTASGRRVVERALAGKSISLSCFASPIEGVVFAVRELPAIVALDGASDELAIDPAVRALRGVPGLLGATMIVFDAASEAHAEEHVRAGATRAIVKGVKASNAPLAKALAEVVPG